MIRTVQAGQGARRPLILLFHQTSGSASKPGFVDARIRAACGPNACILSYTAPVPEGKATTGGAYRRVGSASSNGFALPSLSAVVAQYSKELGCEFSPVVIGGFSEGCQGVRAQLLAGEVPSAIVAADGIHGATNPDKATEVDVWKKYFARARARDSVAIVSHTGIVPPGFASVRTMLELTTGMTLQVPSPAASPSVISDGDLLVWSYAGTDTKAHSLQLQVTLPQMLHEALVRLDVLEEDGPEKKELDRLLSGGAAPSGGGTSGGGVGGPQVGPTSPAILPGSMPVTKAGTNVAVALIAVCGGALAWAAMHAKKKKKKGR